MPDSFHKWLDKVRQEDANPTSLDLMWKKEWDPNQLSLIPTYFPALQVLTATNHNADLEVFSALDIIQAITELPLKELTLCAWTKKSSPSETWDQPVPRFLQTVEKLTLRGSTLHKLLSYTREYLPCLSMLTDLNLLDEPNNLCDLLSTCSNLEKLVCPIRIKSDCHLRLDHAKLKDLTIELNHKKWTTKRLLVSITGEVPSLQTFVIKDGGPGVEIDEGELACFLNSSAGGLKTLSIHHPDAWKIVEKLSAVITPPLQNVQIDRGEPTSKTLSEADRADWEAWRNILHKQFPVNPACLIQLVHKRSRLEEVANMLGPLTYLRLHWMHPSVLTVYHWLLKDSDLMTNTFTNLAEISIFDSNALTSSALSTIVAGLLKLRLLNLTNNHNTSCTELRLQSPTLKEIRLTHFHQLITYNINCPNLHYLELDNCGPNTETSDPSNPYLIINYSNFCEKFLSDLLAPPDEQRFGYVNLTALERLDMWHNPQSLADIKTTDGLAVDIECRAGHEKLKHLRMCNCLHVRGLVLRGLPKLEFLSISGQEKEEEDGGDFVPGVELDLPVGCTVEIDRSLPWFRRGGGVA